MSLLDRRTHSVSVQNMKSVAGPHGSTWVVDGSPETVWGSFQPLSAAESADFDGTVTFTQRRFICRDWPGDNHSVVTASDGVYDTVGDPQWLNMSPATRHWEVVLKRRGVA